MSVFRSELRSVEVTCESLEDLSFFFFFFLVLEVPFLEEVGALGISGICVLDWEVLRIFLACARKGTNDFDLACATVEDSDLDS